MRRFFRSFIASRYVHLVVGLMALYGISEAVTYTDNFEKIVHTLKRYCLTDYYLRDYLNSRDQRGEEYRRERYRKRLLWPLGSGLS